MTKKSTRTYLIQGLTLLVIALFFFLGYEITTLFTEKEETNNNLSYVSYEILSDNAMPVSEPLDNTAEVVAEKSINENDVIRPYTDSNVKVGKTYYNYEDKEENQENSIIFYENTYMQNTGVDYVSKKEFDVNSIADGKVEKIIEDDINGTTIKIKHNNNLISVYSSLKNIQVKENDEVTKGQIIGKSATNSIGEDLGNHLHFELYKDNKLVNPEDVFNNKVE